MQGSLRSGGALSLKPGWFCKKGIHMEYLESVWNGFKTLDFVLGGRKAKLVLPEKCNEGKNWLLKTEYFGAFPQFELDMLARGWHLAYIENETRWHVSSDDEAKEELCRYLASEFGLAAKCVPVGMSCGGLQAVYFAAKYPHRVAALYLDAPVLNLLSCPCSAGIAKEDDGMYQEMVRCTGLTRSKLLNYRNHPIDNIAPILENRIPIMLVCGAKDQTVPYEENGKVLYERVTAAGGRIERIVKPECDHHPHSLEDTTPIIRFVEAALAKN